MSFSNLEQRFNAQVSKLYAGAKSKFDEGKASVGKFDEPYLVRWPGESQTGIKAENRMFPFVSAPRDLKRLTLFQLSGKGIAFLAKQTLLQTGNTFAQSKAINPAFVVGNAVPFVHMRRNLFPIGNLVKRTDASTVNAREMGQLQTETYDRLVSKYTPAKFLEDLTLGAKFRQIVSQTFKSQLLSSITPRLQSILYSNKNVGDKFGYDASGWKKSRPELAPGGLVDTQMTHILKYQADNETPEQYEKIAPTKATIEGIVTIAKGRPFIKYFEGSAGSIRRSTDSTNGTLNAQELANAARLSGALKTGKISYIKDPSNIKANTSNNTLQPYTRIKSDFSDPIDIKFAIGKDDPIKFRALLTDLQENSDPQYSEYHYVGRNEKFINYVGVTRHVGFKLKILAFSHDELEIVWRRINYLTGFVFPYGFTHGIMQPNIVRMTIGQVYDNHPAYLTSLNKNFSEASPTWDIDDQIPIGATLDMKFTLIEKASRIASSPFYKITEEMDTFDNRIRVTTPPITPIGTRIDSNPITNPADAATNYFNGQPMFNDPPSKLDLVRR